MPKENNITSKSNNDQVSILSDINEFITRVPSGRLMGLDFGNKTIGVALGTIAIGVASPLLTVSRTKLLKDITKLNDLIKEENIKGVVLGYPLEMDGTEGERCSKTKDFAHRLMRECHINILLFDERYSTVAVERVLIQAGDISRNKRSKQVDQHAAAFILQGVINGY